MCNCHVCNCALMRVKINKNVWFRENSILKGFNFINRIGHTMVIGKHMLVWLSESQMLVIYINPNLTFRNEFFFLNLYIYEMMTVLIALIHVNIFLSHSKNP